MTVREFRTSQRPGQIARRPVVKKAGVGVVVVLPVLCIVSLFVAFGLPALIEPEQSPSRPPLEAPQAVLGSPPPASVPPIDSERNKEEVDKIRIDSLRRLAQLENEGAGIWGTDPVDGLTLKAVQAALDIANDKYAVRDFSGATSSYQQAQSILAGLAESKPKRLQAALANGRTALAARDSEGAIRQLVIAAALALGDTAIIKDMERARRLPDVLDRFGNGERAERAGDLALARESYEAASALDRDFAPAREGFERVRDTLADREYKVAVTDAHARLNANDLRGASEALVRAQKINSKAPELEDIRKRISGATRIATIERLRAQAVSFEQREQWSDAVKIYDQVLSVDKDAAFVPPARHRAETAVQLHAAIDRYLAEPGRLQSVDSLAHAKTLLRPGEATVEGQALAGKKVRLAEQIAIAQTPVAVTVRSDRNTQVEIQRIGKLGSFDSKQVDLAPGKYVAIGSRTGFRDVRVQFEVTAASKDVSLLVQCTESIR